jgi:diacylglycerol O-acyltransferase/trehalose O-mycolyltransferase
MSRRGRRATLGLAALAGAALSASVSAAPATRVAPDSPMCVVRASPPTVGISELSRTRKSDRVLELRLASSAMQDTQPVSVLLPSGYDPSGATRYPVLYLLHGAFGSHADWVDHGVAQIVGDLQVLVVMPDDGPDGSYSDWYGMVPGATDPIPSWETYHLSELVPFIDRSFPTAADRSHRFIAGLSSGGGGATKYAAARPGLFGAVGSFSGAVDTDIDYPNYANISEALWAITLLPGNGPDAHCTWGDPYTQRVVWRDNTAAPMAENLKGTALFLASGTGEPGPYDAGAPYTDPVEAEVWAMNQELVKELDARRIAHSDDFYGPGHHAWPYWTRDLAHFLTWLRPRIGAPVPAPAAFSHHASRERFAAWGWRFHAVRDVAENTYLEGVSKAGLAVTASGRLHVITAPLYTAGARYAVTVDGGSPRTVRARSGRRLRFGLDLGPSHATQQYDFGADATKGWTHLRVRIEAR